MTRRITRRGVLKAGLIGGPIAVVTAGAGIGGWWWFSVPLDTVGQVPFARPLAIPPLAASELDGAGRRVFELTAQAGTSELLPGASSRSWGYNGSYLGPTLRAAQGETISIHVHNHLDESTTVHWHGMHLPARFDGGPHQSIPPGETWSPAWTIDQPAPATLWYHPHPHRRTREHVNRGLAGVFIIDGPEPEGLPREYGVDDFPVVVQDRRFDGSGQIQIGDFGGTLLVNGTYGPFLEVTTELVRLRLLNASGRRVFHFGFSDDRDFHVIGGDGSLLPAAVQRSRLQLSPAERAEILVGMRPGERVVLRSYEPELGVNAFAGAFVGARDRFDVLELRAAGSLAPSPPPPDRLAPAPDLVEAGADRVDRTFRMQGREINGQTMDMGRIDEVVEVDTTEIWEVRNDDDQYHNFHVHDVQFQVLDVDGQPPAPELAGWKDTVFLRPGSRVRVALRFATYTDPNYPYMYHCHLLRHEDRGMMGQFVVVEPGGSAGTPPGQDGG